MKPHSVCVVWDDTHTQSGFISFVFPPLIIVCSLFPICAQAWVWFNCGADFSCNYHSAGTKYYNSIMRNLILVQSFFLKKRRSVSAHWWEIALLSSFLKLAGILASFQIWFIHTHTHTYIYIYVCVCVYIYIYMWASALCICFYINPALLNGSTQFHYCTDSNPGTGADDAAFVLKRGVWRNATWPSHSRPAIATSARHFSSNLFFSLNTLTACLFTYSLFT